MNKPLAFPYPIVEFGAEPFWQACNERVLKMQACDDCHKYRWHPAPMCPFCGSDNFEWDVLSGCGRVNTWTVVTHPVHPAAVDKVPYVVAVIALDEQADLTMVSNIVDCDPKEIDFDAAVVVDFQAHPNGQKLPVFRLKK